jgi:transposase InsO family protein
LTYLPTTEGWLYLVVVIDLFSRRVVGWAFSSSLESRVVLDAWRMAQAQRNPGHGLVFHSDRGSMPASISGKPYSGLRLWEHESEGELLGQRTMRKLLFDIV